MWFKIIFILLFVSLFTSDFAPAQVPVKTDSTNLYRDIQTYSKRSKFTKLIHQLVFKQVAPIAPKKKSKKKVYKKLIKKSYSSYEGKIIRNINIVTLDPFGYSVSDTNVVPQLLLYKAVNNLHIKTRHITIRNLLLIRRNKPFESLRVSESERLIRKQDYVHEVEFFIKPTGHQSDSVDILIRVSDIWSIIPNGAISTSSVRIDLTDKNFGGLGHEFKNDYTRNFAEGTNAFNNNYTIPNIKNTYISTSLHYSVDAHDNYNRSLNFNRPFFSPLANWAAGVNFTQQFRQDSVLINSIILSQKYKFNAQDYWAGNAIQLFKGNSEKSRTTNFITAVRFLRIRYLEKPTEIVDPLHNLSNENFYLAAIGISTRKYEQDRYIFKHGVTEDVPIGKVISVTGGYQTKNSIDRLYIGARISSGYYYPWGYLSTNFEYGTFFRASHPEQETFRISANYFTGLVELGRWKFRQFVKPQVTIGINRLAYDSLTINDGYGLDGFNSTTLSGNSRFVFTLQTQSYAPWNFYGFHFGPFLSYSVGMLSNSVTGFKNSKIYSLVGFGVLIKNENLIFSTFQFSLTFYPTIPGTGLDVFKANSFRTSDFGFRDFEIGKPAPVTYQ